MQTKLTIKNENCNVTFILEDTNLKIQNNNTSRLPYLEERDLITLRSFLNTLGPVNKPGQFVE